MKAKLRTIFPWLPLVLYWPMMFVATHIPAAKLPRFEIYGRDVTLHFSSFFILAILYWLARYRWQKPDIRKRSFYIAMIVFAVYAALDEISQSFVSRNCSIIDWLSDMSGSLTALILLILVRRSIYWLIIYWPAMFLITHWPSQDTPFLRLPPIWQQYDAALTMVGYSVLTMIWWRTLCPIPRFVFTKKILITSFVPMVLYAFADELFNLVIHRQFSTTDLYSALMGIIFAIITLSVLAHSPEEFSTDND